MNSGNAILDKKKGLYTTVLGQCFSACGKYLACSTNLGKISIFHITPTLVAEVRAETTQPHHSFLAPDSDSVVSLSTNEEFLAGGSIGGKVFLWRWRDLIEKNSEDVIIFNTTSLNVFNNCEINAITFSEDGLRLYTAGGDGLIHIWDITEAKHLKKLEGHTDSILCLVTKSMKIHSGSEDGSVKVWDIRTERPVHEIIPSSDINCSRPHLGNWIKCLTVIPGRDWIVCGGGPHLSLWHEDYKTSLCAFVGPADVQVNDVIHSDGTIISGGNEPIVRHWSINGKEEAFVPCTPTNVFNVDISSSNSLPKVLSVAGNCSKVDICTNFNYKAFSFQVV